MRADRLVALVLLLRRHGRLSATRLARELEVSTRTVLRDVEALSAAGVPIYTDRGRHGGIALLPGFRTELIGLNHDETFALLVAGSRRGAQTLGMGSALASAMLKLVDALPADHQDTATTVAQRWLIEPDVDLLARRQVSDETPADVLLDVRRAVLGGNKLRIRYASTNRDRESERRQDQPIWRTVDPIGIVTVRDHGYLLATRGGKDRTYRLSRISAAKVLPEPADRPEDVDLDQLWRDRSTRFRAGDDRVEVLVRLDPTRRDQILGTALTVISEQVEVDGRLQMEVTFQDARHAEWALWQLAEHGEAVAPAWLRTALHQRATTMATHYHPSTSPC